VFDLLCNFSPKKQNNWASILNSLNLAIYALDHCSKQQYTKKKITIVFENLSLEVLNLLLILYQNYSFIKLRRIENLNINNDFEAAFQLNPTLNKINLNNSTLSILVSNNPKYEGYYLNLNLRQRYLKGDFKCLNIGSLVNATFPMSFLGSNIRVLKTVSEGNSFVSRDLTLSKNPYIIYNNELFKRYDSNNISQILKVLNYSNNFNRNCNGLNLLSPSLSDSSTQLTSKFQSLNSKDLNSSSVLYFINISENNYRDLKKITELKLLNYSICKTYNSLFLDQNYKPNNNLKFFKKTELNLYKHLPNNVFYENGETFINTEGFIKRTTKLISRKKTKSNWQILRKFLKYFKKNFKNLNKKDNILIYFNSKKLFNFKNYANFSYYAIQSLTNLNFYLTIKNSPVIFYRNFYNFRIALKKFQDTKTKYWLDDFFVNGKEEYCQNSLVLSRCSKVLRSEKSIFF
jgi:hypothetical protein